MKSLIILMSLILFNCLLFAQKKSDDNTSKQVIQQEQILNSDSVNISEMVQKQIESARKKELERSKKTSQASIFPIITKNVKPIKGLSPTSLFSSIYFGKIFILLYASILISMFIIIKRLRNKKNNSSNNLKTAINILRNEVVVKKYDKKLDKLRRKIHSSNELKNFGEQEIISTAKKLKISKGELMLAVKIRSHQLNNNYSNKVY